MRDRIADAAPVQSVNIQAHAVAQLFRMPSTEEGFVGVVNQLGVAVIVEILIMLSGVFFELLGREEKPNAAQVKIAAATTPVRIIEAAAKDVTTQPVSRPRGILSLVPPEPREASGKG